MQHRTGSYRANGTTVLGGLVMTLGALVYMNDQLPKLRNFHVFLWPALAIMAIGVVISVVGAVVRDDRSVEPRPAHR